MAEAIHDGDENATRQLAWLFEPFHSVTYYSPEIIEGMPEAGYRGWWHAYFAYRPAPLGPVGANVVTAAFYNFAPRMVAVTIPWSPPVSGVTSVMPNGSSRVLIFIDC